MDYHASAPEGRAAYEPPIGTCVTLRSVKKRSGLTALSPPDAQRMQRQRHPTTQLPQHDETLLRHPDNAGRLPSKFKVPRGQR